MKLKVIKMGHLIDINTYNSILKMAAIRADIAVKADPTKNVYSVLRETFSELGYNYDNIKIIYP